MLGREVFEKGLVERGSFVSTNVLLGGWPTFGL